MKNVNYTPEMIAKMVAAAPVNFDSAKTLAAELGRPVRSVIAKCKSENIEYISKPAPAKKKAVASKAELVTAIEKALDADDGSLVGLSKSTAASLSALLSNIS